MVQDTKSLDGKTSLLSYIARQLSTGHSPAALLAQEVPHVVGPALKTSVQACLFLPPDHILHSASHGIPTCMQSKHNFILILHILFLTWMLC